MKPLLTYLLGIGVCLTVFSAPQSVETRYTSYYPEDPTGSGSCTASGLCIEDFTVDSQGRYRYEGKLVLATANRSISVSDPRSPGSFYSLPSGYLAFDYKDTVLIKTEGQIEEGIVLDICGACYWEETPQRTDIYVSNAEAATDRLGTLILLPTFRWPLLLVYGVILLLYKVLGQGIIKKRRNSWMEKKKILTSEDEAMLKNDAYESELYQSPEDPEPPESEKPKDE